MYHEFNFGDVLASSVTAAWQVEDVQPAGADLDFGRRFLPDSMRAALFERGPKASTGLATGTSKRAFDAALGARHPGPIQFPAAPAAPSIAAPGPGKPAGGALHL
jgi:hypothetical protein